MPDPIEAPVDGKLKDRVASLQKEVDALKAAVTYLLKGAKRVSKEVDDEWGVLTFETGEHFGITIQADN